MSSVTGRPEPMLRLEGAVKRFGAVHALDGVDLELHERETLALVGDNGAGKSTLIKCISGVHRLDGGRMLIDGEEVDFRSPNDARRAGVETVYQDLALFDNLGPAGNFFAGREVTRPRWLGPFGLLAGREMRRRTDDVLERLQVHIPRDAVEVGTMSGGQRQAVACARAVAFASRVVILDEPTAALGVRETANVVNLVKRLPEQGVAVILISHSLDQIAELADRAVVLRRGRRVGEVVPSHESHDELVALITGASSGDQRASASADSVGCT